MSTATHLTRRFEESTGIAADAAHRAIEAADPVLVLARSRTTETSVVELPGLGRAVRKRWTWPRRRDRMKGALRTTWGAASPARREFEALARLRELHFAPEPLAWTEHRVRGVLRTCVLVLAEVRGAVDLASRLADASAGRGRTSVLTLLARRVRAMHDARLVDFEMHPRNVLVAPDGDVLKVDCAKQRRRRRDLSDRDRARDLAALDVALVRLAADGERRAFFDVYGTPPRLAAAVMRERGRIDARESKRLPNRA